MKTNASSANSPCSGGTPIPTTTPLPRRLRPRLRPRRKPRRAEAWLPALALLAFAGFFGGALAAQDTPPDPAAPSQAEAADPAAAENDDEPVIPAAYPEDRYLAVWQKSPFMIEAAPEPAQAQKSFARDYTLSGVLEDDSGAVVYLKNQKTGDFVRIESGKAVDGFTLVKVNTSTDPTAASVTVQFNGETADIGVDPASFSQPASPGTVAAVDPKQAANPNAPPGVAAPNTRVNPRPGAPVANVPGGNTATPRPGAAQPSQANVVNPAQNRLREPTQNAKAGAPSSSRPVPSSPASRRRIILPSQPAER
ncbi:MAG: hypothetical protein H7A53_12605 [Akkermansiaceae bacterium]|nr:hypothetical protein [Akkermansiaceae bacterium]MCP5551721.1 hypothetical protein [Akkermansiaceae bacterium]